MRLKPSDSRSGVIGIAGHAGIGHAFSHSGLVQEDSGGFAVLLSILDEVCPMDLSVASVRVEGNVLVITTGDGGTGRARAPHGFTPYEKALMERARGMRCLAPQTFATQIFGRISGQGTAPTACAFSLATALAMMDTVRRRWDAHVRVRGDDLPGSTGGFAGGCFDLSGEPVAWLLSVNASRDGGGPNEDAEGCVPVGAKAALMEELGMLDIPSIVLEGKSYVPGLQPPVDGTTLFIRWNSEYDNDVVAQCLEKAARESGLPYRCVSDAYPRHTGALEADTKSLGLRIEDLGRQYLRAQTAARKAEVLAALFELCCYDAGASVFMTNAVHEYAGSGGLWPGLGAMFSLTVPSCEAEEWKCLILTEPEIRLAAQVTLEAAGLLLQRRDEAARLLRSRRPALGRDELLAMATGRD